MAVLAPLLLLGFVAAVLVFLLRPTWGLVLFCLLTPMGLMQLPGSLQLITLSSMALIAFALWERLWDGQLPIPSSWASLSATLWSLGIVLSVLVSGDPGRSAVFGAWQIVAVWTAVSFGHLAGRADRFGVALRAWLFGGALVGASGLAFNSGGLGSAYGGALVTGRPVGVFAQPNEYGTYCMLMWVFSLGIAVLLKGTVRWIAMLTSVTCLAGLVLSLSRGSWIGAAAGACLLAVFMPQTRKPQAFGLILVTSLVGVCLVALPYWQLPQLLLSRLLTIFQPSANPFDDRQVLMAEGIRQFGDRPMLGQGPNMYPVVAGDVGSIGRTVPGDHPHSFFIAIAAEQGLLGLLATLGFVVAVGLAVVVARRPLVSAQARTRAVRRAGSRGWSAPVPPEAAVVLCAAASLGAFLVEGLVDYPMRNALVRMSAWTMLGWVLAGQRGLADGRAGDAHVSGTGLREGIELPVSRGIRDGSADVPMTSTEAGSL